MTTTKQVTSRKGKPGASLPPDLDKAIDDVELDEQSDEYITLIRRHSNKDPSKKVDRVQVSANLTTVVTVVGVILVSLYWAITLILQNADAIKQLLQIK